MALFDVRLESGNAYQSGRPAATLNLWVHALVFWRAIGRKTGSHPRVKPEDMLLLIARPRG
jgi:hypothetical protein